MNNASVMLNWNAFPITVFRIVVLSGQSSDSRQHHYSEDGDGKCIPVEHHGSVIYSELTPGINKKDEFKYYELILSICYALGLEVTIIVRNCKKLLSTLICKKIVKKIL